MANSRSTPSGPQQPQGAQPCPPLDPRMMAALYGLPDEDEIDLLEYWRVLWKRKWLIIGVSLLAAVVAAAISLAIPNRYKAEVLLAPVSNENSKGGGLSSMLGGLGGLASMAGISLPGGGSAEQNLAVLKSRAFLWRFIQDNKLMPILFADRLDASGKHWKESDPEKQPTLWDGYRLFTKSIMEAEADKKSGLVTVSVEWTDPALAARWANDLVARLNTFLRDQAIARSRANLKYLRRELERTSVADMRKTLFELIASEQKKAMLANTQKQFAFRILDPATPPDKKSKPKRALIVLLSALVAGFLSVIFVFIREGIERRRAEEQATETDAQGGAA